MRDKNEKAVIDLMTLLNFIFILLQDDQVYFDENSKNPKMSFRRSETTRNLSKMEDFSLRSKGQITFY
jgi:hypothetical protein